MAAAPSAFEPLEDPGPFIEHVGPVLAEGDVLGLRIESRHLNASGMAQGGLLTTLVGLLNQILGRRSADDERRAATVSLTTDFLGAAREGDWVEARTEVERLGGTLAFADCSLFGIAAGVVRGRAVFAGGDLQAFMLSPYFHLFQRDPARAADALHPRDLAPEVRARAVEGKDLDRALIASFVDTSADFPGDDLPWRTELLDRALAPDLTYQRGGAVLRAAFDPPFFATYYRGLDVVGHTFLRFARPDAFGDVRPEERRRYGNVVDAYAELLGQAVGDLAQSVRPGEVLIVVSAYGMEPLPPWRRAWESLLGDRWASGTHGDAPDGVVLAVGDGIRPGAMLRNASVLDLAPTVLYLMGLPVARDMEGRILTEMLQDDFMRAHPVTFIPSYESLAVTPTTSQVPPGLPPLPDESP